MQDPDPRPHPIDHVALGHDDHAHAMVTKAETLTYAEVERAVGRLAAVLAACVREPGARVATWLPKSLAACLMPLAAPRAGLIHVPVNPMLKRAQLAHILADSGASLLLTARARAQTLAAGDVPPSCDILFEDSVWAMSADADPLPPSNAAPDTLAAILYTSGSTGQPKGVMLSHANLWLGAVSVAHYLGLGADDRTLAVLPLGFDYGQNQLFSTWRAGGCVQPLDYLVARDVWRVVEAGAITTLAAVPPLWLQLVEAEAAPARGVRRITNSGGALTPALIDRLRARFPNADIYPMYGLTEAFRSTFLAPDLVASHPTAMGRAIPFAEVMAVGANGDEALPDEPGELVHAGPLVAKGYWGDAARTAARFRPAPPWSNAGGVAVWSGDTVRRDKDGLFHFVGRDDEMIKSSGHRISPGEIEAAATRSGVVAEAVAHGIVDEALGQVIRLVVRGDTGAHETLAQFLKRELPSYMQPRLIEWRDILPRNVNGKIDRAAIGREVR